MYDAKEFPTTIDQESSVAFLLTLSIFVLYKSSLAIYTVKPVLRGHHLGERKKVAL
jgi:hypothetical protein